MAEVIYCRKSTEMQQFDSQTQALVKKYPGARIVTETASGAKARPVLKALIAELTEEDTLIVAGFDRLGRNVLDLLTLIQDLETRGITIVFDREGFVFNAKADDAGFNRIIKKMMMQMLASLAEMERLSAIR